MRFFHLFAPLVVLPFGVCALAQPQSFSGDVREQKGAVPAQKSEPLTSEARADIFMARKMYREAAETYLQAKPYTHITLNKVGIAYHQLGDLDTAKKYYERSIKADPKYPEAINNLGTIFYAKKSYRRAVSTYKRALKLSPDPPSMYPNPGPAHSARRAYKEASLCYEKALTLDPEVFEHRGTQGVLLQERSVTERAKFHYYLAKTYAKAGREDLALLYIRKSLEEGFKERQKFMEDSEFAQLRKNPEFTELMKLEPRVL